MPTPEQIEASARKLAEWIGYARLSYPVYSRSMPRAPRTNPSPWRNSS
jgi:hypothetical protein